MARMSKQQESGTGRQGFMDRLWIAGRVSLTGALALIAVLLINWLAARPDLRVRLDWTETGQNTVGAASASVLERLPGSVTLDVFFRPEEPPLTQVSYIAQERTRRLLLTLRESSLGRLELRHNDLSDVEAVEKRLAELRLRGFENCIVVSYGDQREVVSLNGGLAVFDPGSPAPDPRPARIVEFSAEKALISAMLKVTRGAAREVYFMVGQGQREVDDTSSSGLSELDRQLAQDGLGVSRWNPLTDGPIPEDCACLSIIAPTDALSDDLLDSIESWVRGGGRLVLVPHPEDDRLDASRIGELSSRFGMDIQHGIVCQPVVDPQTGRLSVGDSKVSSFFVSPNNMAGHELVLPIKRGERSFVMPGTHPIRRTAQPAGGVTAPLFFSSAESWVDGFQPSRTGPTLDFRPDPEMEATGRRFELAMASAFPPIDSSPQPALEETPQARIVVVGSSMAFSNGAFRYNQDLLNNVYNWVLDREYRLSISARNPDVRLIPIEKRERALPRLNRMAWGYLPGLCLLLGGLVAAMRSRTGQTRPAGEDQ